MQIRSIACTALRAAILDIDSTCMWLETQIRILTDTKIIQMHDKIHLIGKSEIN